MARAIVLGSGMVGSVIAADLSADLDVTLVDRSEANLARAAVRAGGKVQTQVADLSDPARIRALVAEYDVVVGALASILGYRALRAVVEAVNLYADISFMAEDAMDHDSFAVERGATAVVDCGVAPGMSNLLSGQAVARLDRTDRLDIYVGGLPVERRMPFQFKAAFAPYDVIEEYVRPSRLVEHGQVVVREALSEPEPFDFDGIGTLEAFNTDGLRSLIHTLKVPFMREKTLRYPGHIDLMKAFRAAGLFSHEPVGVGDQQVRPIDLTAALLFPKWTYEEGEADLTVMRVQAEGLLGGRRVRLSWDLDDRFDPISGFTSMSRTTGFPCAIFARLLLEGKIPEIGVLPPERLGHRPELVAALLEGLAARGIHYREQLEDLGPATD